MNLQALKQSTSNVVVEDSVKVDGITPDGILLNATPTSISVDASKYAFTPAETERTILVKYNLRANTVDAGTGDIPLSVQVTIKAPPKVAGAEYAVTNVAKSSVLNAEDANQHTFKIPSGYAVSFPSASTSGWDKNLATPSYIAASSTITLVLNSNAQGPVNAEADAGMLRTATVRFTDNLGQYSDADFSLRQYPKPTAINSGNYYVTFVARVCEDYSWVMANATRNNYMESVENVGSDYHNSNGQTIRLNLFQIMMINTGIFDQTSTGHEIPTLKTIASRWLVCSLVLALTQLLANRKEGIPHTT
ncbi:MAG: hypothetical protein LBP35_04230 [Candidatus Ancillula trichonymphae]|nr:hypothetical protein [Candidatus Ancillula trichonymphae]